MRQKKKTINTVYFKNVLLKMLLRSIYIIIKNKWFINGIRILFAGYRWAHSYTQCIIKNILHSFRHKSNFDRDKCESKQDDNLEIALKYLEAEHELDPKDTAIIKFQPSLFDPKTEYGDEMFFPSADTQHRYVEQDNVYVETEPKYTMNDQESTVEEGL